MFRMHMCASAIVDVSERQVPTYVGTLYMCCVAQDQASWFLRQGLGVGLSRRDLSTRWECQKLQAGDQYAHCNKCMRRQVFKSFEVLIDSCGIIISLLPE